MIIVYNYINLKVDIILQSFFYQTFILLSLKLLINQILLKVIVINYY